MKHVKSLISVLAMVCAMPAVAFADNTSINQGPSSPQFHMDSTIQAPPAQSHPVVPSVQQFGIPPAVCSNTCPVPANYAQPIPPSCACNCIATKASLGCTAAQVIDTNVGDPAYCTCVAGKCPPPNPPLTGGLTQAPYPNCKTVCTATAASLGCTAAQMFDPLSCSCTSGKCAAGCGVAAEVQAAYPDCSCSCPLSCGPGMTLDAATCSCVAGPVAKTKTCSGTAAPTSGTWIPGGGACCGPGTTATDGACPTGGLCPDPSAANYPTAGPLCCGNAQAKGGFESIDFACICNDGSKQKFIASSSNKAVFDSTVKAMDACKSKPSACPSGVYGNGGVCCAVAKSCSSEECPVLDKKTGCQTGCKKDLNGGSCGSSGTGL